MKRLMSSLSVTLIVLMIFPSVAGAIEYGGVGGKPANPQPNNPRTQSIFIYELKPSESTTDGVKVFNNTSTQRTIAVDAVDSVLSSGGAFACAQSADQRTDVGSWIGLSTKNIVLPAGGSQVVPFTVTVPAKADVGEHDGCITIQDTTAAAKSTTKSGVILGFRSAMRVVVTVPGTIVKKLTLLSVDVQRSKDGNYTVTPKARNDGNVSLDTDVNTKLTSLLGISTASSGGTYPVLPRSTASWNLEVKRPFWGGWHHATATVTYNTNPTSLVGQNQGPQKTETMNSAVFFVPPSSGAIVIYLIILLAIGVIVWLYVRRQRDIRQIRKHWQEYIVKDKDTIMGVAKDHHTSWKKLSRVNKIKPPYSLQKGQKLRVPPKREK